MISEFWLILSTRDKKKVISIAERKYSLNIRFFKLYIITNTITSMRGNINGKIRNLHFGLIFMLVYQVRYRLCGGKDPPFHTVHLSYSWIILFIGPITITSLHLQTKRKCTSFRNDCQVVLIWTDHIKVTSYQ